MSYLLDTHPFVWWLRSPGKLSKPVLKLLGEVSNQFYVPAMVVLEMKLLIEIGRVDAEISDAIAYVKSAPNFSLVSFDESALVESIRVTSSRDPFDRSIVAIALAHGHRLITEDRWMHDNFEKIVLW